VVTTAGHLEIGADLLVAKTGKRACRVTTVTSAIVGIGYNVVDDTSCALTSTATSKQTVANPLIGLLTLADNGGPTQTQAISKTSAANDVIPAAATVDGTDFCSGNDQRGVGFHRLVPGTTMCAAGAFQPGATLKVTGYDLVGSDGGVFVFDAPGQTGGFFGSLPSLKVAPAKPVVGMVPTVSDQGYFLVGADGGVFAFGTAPFLGSLPGIKVTPNQPIVGIVAANTDRGYFLVGRDGGVYAFGAVNFLGSLPGNAKSVNNVIGISAEPSGAGYWVVQATGTVTAFGNASSFSTPPTTSPVTAIAGTATGQGYWLVTQEGGVYALGDAKKAGAGTLPTLHVTPSLPVIGLVPTEATAGYWLLGADGGIFAFNAPFDGSLPGLTPPVHVTNIVGAVPN
jgi:hypothetical protein